MYITQHFSSWKNTVFSFGGQFVTYIAALLQLIRVWVNPFEARQQYSNLVCATIPRWHQLKAYSLSRQNSQFSFRCL